MSEEVEGIVSEIEIQRGIEQVFNQFSAGFSKWWPKEYTWSQNGLVAIGLEL